MGLPIALFTYDAVVCLHINTPIDKHATQRIGRCCNHTIAQWLKV